MNRGRDWIDRQSMYGHYVRQKIRDKDCQKGVDVGESWLVFDARFYANYKIVSAGLFPILHYTGNDFLKIYSE